MEEKENIKSYFDLEVWQLAHKLVMMIYKLIEDFSKKGDFRFTSQLLQSAVSIPANIAEGKGRNSLKYYMHFLIIASGSLEETKYYIYLAKELNYIDDVAYNPINDKLNYAGKKLNSLINSLKSKI